MAARDRAIMLFTTKFGESPEGLVRAPGSINLIGEHTDYNQGFVLPVAIDKSLWIAYRPREDREVRVRSEGFVEDARFNLDVISRGEGWAEYVKGVAWALTQAGNRLNGWEGVATSDIPMGAGLSSSGALGVAAEAVFSQVSDLGWDPGTFAELEQRAENEWIGVRSGIMDPLTVTCAKPGHAMLIDCHTLRRTHVPLPDGVSIVVMDTGTRRHLADSEYNDRRARCEQAAQLLGVPSLSDVDMDRLISRRDAMDEATYHSALHVVTENARTLAAVDSLRHADVSTLGKLMNESHTSLRDDLRVSSRPLDAIVEIAQHTDGCLGARLTGGGFAGAAIALVEAEAVPGFLRSVSDTYHEETGLQAHLYVTTSAGRAEFIRL